MNESLVGFIRLFKNGRFNCCTIDNEIQSYRNNCGNHMFNKI